jgi:hypothetical protein
MGRMRPLRPACRRAQIDQHSAVLDLDREGRHTVFLGARFADTTHAVELPVMPWTDDAIAVEATLAERAACVVAGVGDDAEAAIAG